MQLHVKLIKNLKNNIPLKSVMLFFETTNFYFGYVWLVSKSNVQQYVPAGTDDD